METEQALKLYHARGFHIVNIHNDMEFECIQHNFLPTTINLTLHNVHVSEVEHSIWTIKEQIRADIHGLPFMRLPQLMIVELIRQAVILFNSFPTADGISKALSPKKS